MSYTKAEFIEQIYIKVTGGQLSPDVNVKREDIEAYLAQAINYVTTKEIRLRKREDESQAIDPEFYKTYENIETKFDEERNLFYISLPERLQAIPSTQGIASLAPMWADVPYIRLRSRYELGAHTNKVDNIFYWYEQISGGGGEERLYFKNLGYPRPLFTLRMIPSFESLKADDIINMPSGMEVEVLELAYKWFAEQRQMPADMLNNNRDDKQ